MCKKIRRSALILTLMLSLQCLLAGCSGIFSPQYNKNGSHFFPADKDVQQVQFL